MKKVVKPIPTSSIIGIGLLGISILLFKYDQLYVGVLTTILTSMILMINLFFMPCSTLFLKKQINKKSYNHYKEFASFYLKDRRLHLSKDTFKKAIENKWLDVITMFILLGVKKNLTETEKKEIILNVFYEDDFKIYELLANAGFDLDFIVPATQEHFIFETLTNPNVFYLEKLIKKRINVNVVNSINEKLLFVVIREKRLEHLKLLLKYDIDLTIENNEKLTPIFYALVVENVEACELITNKMSQQKASNHKIEFKVLKEPLILNSRPIDKEDTQTLINLMDSKDDRAVAILKEYFMSKKDCFLKVEPLVALYTRLSKVEVGIQKKEEGSQSSKYITPEEEWKADIFRYIQKNYKFTQSEMFKIDGIYKSPKYIDTYKEDCPKCQGEQLVLCKDCKGVGLIECNTCKGSGNQDCPECKGTHKVACVTLKKYVECKNCTQGIFKCIQCNDEGLQECPECEGHGTKGCKCPKEYKVQCPHCKDGYVAIKNGMYKKCSKCTDGFVCGLCHDTGRVLEKFKEKGFKCNTCKGTKKVKCTVCEGKRKIRCTRRFEIDCNCNEGKIRCEKCNGNKKVACPSCNGTKTEACAHCADGYIYTNTAIDFIGTNKVVVEKIVTSGNDDDFDSLLPSIAEKIVENHPYVQEVYSMNSVDIKKQDIVIKNTRIEKEVHKLIASHRNRGQIEILEVAPLHYKLVTFEYRDGRRYKIILINDVFYKVLD